MSIFPISTKMFNDFFSTVPILLSYGKQLTPGREIEHFPDRRRFVLWELRS